MAHTRRSHARSRAHQPDLEELRKRRDSQRPNSSVPLSEPGVVKLQHVIGNQAAQRLIQKGETVGALQRAPNGGKPEQKEAASDARVVATITLESGGEVRGESRIAGHEGKIEFLSMHFEGLNRRVSRDTETEEERVSLVMTKYVDSASMALFNAMNNGDAIKSARFELIRRDADGKISIFQTYEYTNGYITSLSVSGAAGGDRPIETLALEFRTTPKK